MGHSLPIQVDTAPAPPARRARTGASLVTPDPDPVQETGGPTPASASAEALEVVAAEATAEALLAPTAPEEVVPAAGPAEPDAFSAAIVRSKIRAPAIRQNTLERPRLLGWLERNSDRRVRLISAEAGYGKSTLLADHAHRGDHPTAWYRLESSDRDWVTALNYIVASIREVRAGFGTATANLLQRVGVLNATRDMALDMLLADLESSVSDPLTLILDDFHVVQDSDDIRAILARLIDHAPACVTFIIAGRSRPGVPFARYTALGQVAELGTQDLRFTRSESADLLARSFGGPLDDDLVQIVDDRLAGWGASLQLVGTSLVSLQPQEARQFIEDLTSRSDPLYDFLAEEVLNRQTAVMRRVLSVAAILERIDAELVLAAMSTDNNLSPRRIEVSLSQAEGSGILSRTSANARWWRFHPLVRDFMLSRLMENVTREALLQMHLRVAIAAESIDWLASAHHYIEAEHQRDAMRVLRDSAIEALGTASWGAATTLVDRMPEQPVPDAVTVLQARAMVARGQVERGIEILEALSPSPRDPMAWGITKAALANAYFSMGRLDGVRAAVADMARYRLLPPVVASIARGFAILVRTHEGGRLSDASEVLLGLARDHARLGLTHFAGVGFHNAGYAAFARGQYELAVTLGKWGVEQFKLTKSGQDVESTHAAIALAMWELGHPSRAAAHLAQIGSSDVTPVDALTDAAWIASATGDQDTAWVFLEKAARTVFDGGSVPTTHAILKYSTALAFLVDGNPEAARRSVVDAGRDSTDFDATVRRAAMEAWVALAADDKAEAIRAGTEGLAVAEGQGAVHWERWLRLLVAVAESDADDFRRALVALVANAKLSTLALADAIAMGLGMLDEVPLNLVELIRAWPGRWLPVLRRVIQGNDKTSALTAAELLATLGAVEDVALLSAFERKHVRQAARRTYSRRLARHANPTMVVHDLGRVRIQLGQRVVPLSQTRRKAASLLAFLASRPVHSATRDQVLEAMWPSQSPEGAANSLHQTLYFLRRDIDPWFEEGNAVDYLVVEPDVVFLDPDLVQVDSAAFFRQASAALTANNMADVGVRILRDYPAKFALDFEYEDWSEAWRDRLHALFLQATQVTADALIRVNRHQLAIEVVGRAVAIDPAALDLEASLIVALQRAGATAAAAHQYRHYAKAFEDEIGDAPPPLAALLGSEAPLSSSTYLPHASRDR